MNQTNDASLGLNQAFPQDQSLLNSNIQQALSNVMQQNPINAWQQAQFAMAANQQLPALNMQAQQLGQLPWSTHMSNPPQLQNPMLQMPFNMPLISQQIIQEAFSMSQPVDAADEPILLTALLKAKKTEQNFKEALTGLHGTKGHSASLWKDYYLEHKDRLDDWIEMCIKKEVEPSLVTVKKPSPASFKPLPKPSRPSVSAPSSSRPSAKAQKQKPPLPTRDIPTVEGRRRSTMNSLSVPEPVFDSRLPAPNAAVKAPDPPSRSPTPPTNIVPQRRGNKFTTEDREFFIKFLGWQLRQNPELNRQELCEMLAEKAPHHTAPSWGSFWSNNHDLPDKILASARGELDEDTSPTIQKSRPNYKDVTTSEDESGEEQAQDVSGDESESSTEPVRRHSVSDMGERNDLFTEADRYFTAKYIASSPNWDTLTSKDRWGPFQAKYPQRTAKSWGEYYRRYEKSLLKLAKKIHREKSSSSQYGRPSKIPRKAKRRLSNDRGEDEDASKRTKIDKSP